MSSARHFVAVPAILVALLVSLVIVPPPPAVGADPAEPFRVLDTREGDRPVAESTRCVVVTGRGGVPTDAAAVAVNLAAVDVEEPGFVQAYADGVVRPDTVVLNHAAGQSVASSSSVVAVGTGGRICLYTLASVHLVVDVTGSFSAEEYRPVTPFRARDSRTSALPQAETSLCTTVAGVGGVPADAVAVTGNLAAVGPQARGFLTAYPAGAPVPVTSNVNYEPGDVLNNGVTVAVGDGGRICVYTKSASHHTLDVTGWFAADGEFQTLTTPRRLLDTRGETRPGAASTTCLQVTGNGVPGAVDAALVTVTAVQADEPGFVTAYASGTTRPPVSSGNYEALTTRATSTLVAVGDDGQVCVYTTAAADLVVDLAGFSVPPLSAGDPAFSPFRALDTRVGPIPGDASIQCVRVAGHNGVSASATAVAVNLAAVQQTGAGFLTMFPSGSEVPEISSLNYGDGSGAASSSAIVEVGDGGEICAFVRTSTHVVIDVTATFEGTTFQPIQPVRLVDTRAGVVPAASSPTCVRVAGVAGVPADAASVSINLAAAGAGAAGFLVAYPAGGPVPPTSNLNVDMGEVVGNGAVVAVGEAGRICLRGSVAAHHLIDLTGWFAADSPVQTLPVARRVLDTRAASRPTAESAICVPVVGNGVPVDATAVHLTVTSVRPDDLGFVTAYASGQTRPEVSSLNYDSGTVRATGGVVPVGEDGEVCLWTKAATDLVVDLTAYQTPASAPDDVLRREPSGRVGTCAGGEEELVDAADVSWWDWITTIESRGSAGQQQLFEVEAYHRVLQYERCAGGVYVHEWVGEPVSHLERCAVTTGPTRLAPSRLEDLAWAGETWTSAGPDNPCPTSEVEIPTVPAEDGEAAPGAAPIDPAAEAIRRLAGAGRQQTAAVIAGHAYPEGAEVVFIAEEEVGLPAALASGTTQTGPVLLTGGGQAPIQEVIEAIADLGAQQVVALGGVDSGVDSDIIEEMARGRPTDRIEGEDIFGTAAMIAAAGWPDGADTVYLAESVSLADGLAGGTVADGPIVLVPAEGVVPSVVRDVIEQLDPRRVVALGGADAVSTAVLTQAAAGRAVERIEGPTRFETAAAVSEVVFAEGAPTVYLARADIAPDAVVAGSVTDGPILLVETCNGVHPATAAEIERLGAEEVIGLGGPDAICDETVLAAQPSGVAR